ncbi:hypothetical protein RRG08_036750 [Elysia crispata]|uniref:Uncharacterized protein n=1 Tax=Elysia crispata TaxID=231223 RepID=A0AAE1DFV0_9GAST|nr:hypothetical protein RRG08_036750 [Elysia crispata]
MVSRDLSWKKEPRAIQRVVEQAEKDRAGGICLKSLPHSPRGPHPVTDTFTTSSKFSMETRNEYLVANPFWGCIVFFRPIRWREIHTLLGFQRSGSCRSRHTERLKCCPILSAADPPSARTKAVYSEQLSETVPCLAITCRAFTKAKPPRPFPFTGRQKPTGAMHTHKPALTSTTGKEEAPTESLQRRLRAPFCKNSKLFYSATRDKSKSNGSSTKYCSFNSLLPNSPIPMFRLVRGQVIKADRTRSRVQRLLRGDD